jgi:tripeptidyl-peptidase I
MVPKVLILFTIFSLALAKPTTRNMVVRESRQSFPSGYVRTGPASADTELKLRIALVQNNPDGLATALYDVSTPGSPSYGEHLNKEEVCIFCIRCGILHSLWLRRSKVLSLRLLRGPKF